MKSGAFFWVLISFTLLFFSGIAGAHPHGLGTVNHGPSLESYQVDFTTATKNSINDPHDPGMTLANKSKKSDKSGKSEKSGKSLKSGKSGKSHKSGKSYKSEKSGKSIKSDKSDKK